MSLFGGTIKTLEHGLDFASAKNKAISNNIANVDTPHYKAKNVQFKDELHKFMDEPLAAKRTHPKHLTFSAGNPQQPYRTSNNSQTVYNHNGNNVDIDKEMAELAKNQIYYQALIDRLNGKFGSLQTVIRGGR
ncbi:Flagellar basal body rod protein FlgB [Lentibacillus sp. JNUCC-1]|uniref:flagellar basal body rod protein FlgB n=1 Tax=Lentibacillus sp. JNUCC-1 TaxID=2654513 RepID=UPI0012E7EE75|nr:flagellar basal body rod protein FlgB [Lentibacillus sp. JNUCC-1]MUV39970.1 Flagellar basal body rod protein FlgB [Lentibacillus sp. JNUCC-1]